MRNLNQEETDSLYVRGKCPFCGSTNFLQGPSGGMSTNYYCANDECSAGFNLSGIKEFSNQLIREPLVMVK